MRRFIENLRYSSKDSTANIASRQQILLPGGSSSKPSSSKAPACDNPPPYEEHQTIPQISTLDSAFDDLKNYDTILLVEDSSSMDGPRWREAEAAIAAIAGICTKHDTDGIDLYFLNHRKERNAPNGAYTNIKIEEQVRNIFASVAPRGATPVGRRLRDILQPYMYRVKWMQQAPRDMYGELRDPALFVRPINIITITDGEFTDDAESIIGQFVEILDMCVAPPEQVGIQFFQIGEDEDARAYLEELDNNLGQNSQRKHVRDIVDTVPWRGSNGSTLDGEGVLKCVLGAVNKRLDRKKV
ncbi:hypothetical protein N7494_013174 [Penicillium frequentans]|uniref:VWFA domain-containing protein n=1 Tax=Penicillium frequentans TaxID=3151616 RepID=A0AAD6G8Y5_9EURO|nr:hypothetical protein N7494_013174 [Penicillium glabrum]